MPTLYHPTIPGVTFPATDVQLDEAHKAGWLAEEPDYADSGVTVERDGGGSRPKESAPKAEWIEYAVAGGVDRPTAEDSTKAELIAMTSKL